MKQEVVVAVIGLGRIGKKHAELLVREVPNCRVKYAVDVFLNDAMRAWAQELGIEQTTADANDALRDPEVDAVYICTSTGTHSAYIMLAAQAGKNIFCEKPLDSDLERLYAALREVEKAGVKFQTGFMRRFDTNHNKVKQTLYSGEVGTPQMIRLSCRDNVQSPFEYLKVSGGIFFDMMIHDFDMVRFLSNSEVREVYATGGCYVDPRLNEIPDVDTAVAVLKLENGMIAVIDNGRQCWYGHDQRSEAYCTKGTVQAMNVNEDTVVVSNAESIHTPKPLDFFLERYAGAHVKENQLFIQSVLEDRPVAVTAFDGVQPIRIAKAAHRSFLENRPVQLSEIPAL